MKVLSKTRLTTPQSGATLEANLRVARSGNWWRSCSRDPLSISDLVPNAKLQLLGDSAQSWLSLGEGSAFDSFALLKAGWLRIDLQLRHLSSKVGEVNAAELFADYGDGFEAGESLLRIIWSETLADEVFVRLPRPLLAIRFVPIGSAGLFIVDRFQVESLTRFGMLREAIRRKLRMLRTYRCTGRVLRRGLKMLATGRFLGIYAKIVKGLPDSRLMQPETAPVPIQSGFAVIGPALPRPNLVPNPLVITGNVLGSSAWDGLVLELAKGLKSLGIETWLNSGSQHRPELLPLALAGARRRLQPSDTELLVCPPSLLARHEPRPGFVLYSMWESERLLPEWVDRINQSRCVVVPSQWCATVFRSSGVTVPISVVPLGHDPLLFHDDGSRSEICTFGTAGSLAGGGIRKRIDRSIDLFRRAFPHQDDVRLRIKISPTCDLVEPDDPRIEILKVDLSPARLADWYRSLWAYLNLSAAEGFGLQPLEAMACARPVISTAYSGVTEYFDEQVGIAVSHREVPTGSDFYPGKWSAIDEDETIQAMRWVYENESLARELGHRAASRARLFSWNDTGRRLLTILGPTK